MRQCRLRAASRVAHAAAIFRTRLHGRLHPYQGLHRDTCHQRMLMSAACAHGKAMLHFGGWKSRSCFKSRVHAPGRLQHAAAVLRVQQRPSVIYSYQMQQVL